MNTPPGWDVMSPHQRTAWFDEQHGKDEAILGESGFWILFPDGARRELNTLGALIEPPEDELERLSAIQHYHDLLLHRAIAEFRNLRQQLRWGVQAGGSVSDHEKQRLRDLREQVLGHRKDVKDVEKQIYDHPKNQRERESQRRDEERRWEQLSEIESINI